MKIYTKNGDTGNSAIMDAVVRSKNETVFEALGALDEFNATLGIVSTITTGEIKKLVLEIQSDLFYLGSFIAGKKFTKTETTYWEIKTAKLEATIDAYEKKNKPLTSFILPGGSVASAYLHVSRGVCRRAERNLVTYVKSSTSKNLGPIIKYINRLSDLLFVVARYTNLESQIDDITWKCSI